MADPLNELNEFQAKQHERRDRSGPSSPAAVEIDTATTAAAVEIHAATTAAIEIDTATADAADADVVKVFDAKLAVTEHAYRLKLTNSFSASYACQCGLSSDRPRGKG